jgi:hypothetical protein
MSPRILLLAAVAACNPVVAHLPDADLTKKDAAIDAAPQLVTVTVLDLNGTGALLVGVPVVFVNPNGTVVAHPSTDVHGKAAAEVLAGASVTAVLQPQPTSFTLFTVQAVKPGDDIVIGPPAVDYSSAGTFNVTFSAATGATYYYVYGPCGSNYSATAGTVAVPMLKSCKLDSMEIQVHAFNNTGASVGYVSMTGVSLANGAVTMPSTYSAYTNVTATYSNVSQLSGVQTQRFAPTDENYGTNSTYATPAGATLANIVGGPVSSTATIQSQFQDNNGNRQRVTENLGGTATTYALDTATTLLPWFNTVTFDPATAKATVTTSSVGTTTDAPDMFFLDVSYSRMVDANTYDSFSWVTIGPTPGDVTLPTLTDDLASLNPLASDTVGSSNGGMFDSSEIPGYDMVRPNPFAAIGLLNSLRGSTAKLRESETASRGGN